ncbi:hypothetical protein PybrP1_011643 [[Pythium] brassicae (nom. inval.)]|nr:hypothetical protein PybrP1_011643 [[Pythium] brassicae (nom. inval.)]
MISPKVMVELHQAKLVPTQFTVTKPGEHAWSSAEQRRFWEAIHRFPQGPWTAIAAYVGSKSTRQAMTHAQKLRQKLNRWKRRVRNDPNGAGAGSGASSPRSEALDMDNETDENENENEEDEEADGGDERWRGDAESALKVECEEVSPGRVKSDLAAATRPQYAPYSSDVGYEGCSSRGGEQRYYHHQQPHHAPMKATLSFDVSSLSPADVSGGDHDEYLDHLLSDIEPMLENVVNFSSPSRAATSTQQHYVPILPWSPATTPQMVLQEHLDFVHDAPPDSPLFESDDDLAAFLLEDYEPLLFSDDFDASLEDEQEISRILAECGW